VKIKGDLICPFFIQVGAVQVFKALRMLLAARNVKHFYVFRGYPPKVMQPTMPVSQKASVTRPRMRASRLEPPKKPPSAFAET